MKRRVTTLISFLLLLAMSGCALFTSPYDATRHENFTKLKAMHIKLFDNWTEGSAMAWNEGEVKQYCEAGDLKFREAFEFARSKDSNDKTGQTAVKILWDEFSDNCRLSLKKKKLFSKVYAEETRPQIEQNYGYAIAGELERVNGDK